MMMKKKLRNSLVFVLLLVTSLSLSAVTAFAYPANGDFNLSGSSTTTSISLSWDSYPLATSYTVLIKEPGSSSYTTVTSGLPTRTLTMNLPTNDVYKFYVVAYSGATPIASSNEITLYQKSYPPTGVPALTGIAGNQSNTISWTNTWGATSHSVFLYIPGVGLTPLATNLTTTSFVHTGLTNGTTYTYVVFAYAGTKQGLASDISLTPQP